MKLILFTTGEVTSPNYPNNYPNNLEKTQTIRVEEGLVLSLQFTAFDIESCSSCWCDHLTITDSDGTTLMEKSCGSSSSSNIGYGYGYSGSSSSNVVVGGQSIGSSLPAAVTSTSNSVNLVFSTDSYGQRTGWSVSWSAVTPGECQQQHL